MRLRVTAVAAGCLSLATVLALHVGTRGTSALLLDLVIRNGLLLQDESTDPVPGDIGIRDGRIAAIGSLDTSRAGRVVDARGRLVTPGFIDSHSHAAAGLARLGLHQGGPLLAQGVTTIVGNPDGSGPIELGPQVAELERRGIGPNVALLIGHGSVRRAVLGMEDRPPSDRELLRMEAIVRAAMRDGALGLSTGLFYLPGSHARTEEVTRLARVAGEFGGVHQSHIRDEGDYTIGLIASVDEIIQVAEASGTTGIVSHLKALGPDTWGLAPKAVERIEAARARGLRVYADQYPYDAWSTGLVAALVPAWVQAGGAAEMRRRLTEAATRERVLAGIRAGIRRRGGAGAILLAHYAPRRAYEGMSLAAIAAELRVAPERAVVDLALRGDASIVSFNMNEDDVAAIMRQPWTMTASDGGLVFPTEGRPHPRSYGAFTRKLERYVRQRRVLTLPQAIRSMTTLPASVYGLHDRGALRVGAWADLAVFDPADLHETATYEDPHQLAKGMAYVLVNGVPVIDDGAFTAALPGRVILGPRAGSR